MEIPSIDLKEFEYTLPENRIAKFPLEKRDSSQLLEYRNGTIQHHNFFNLPGLLDADSLLVYNNTKVIPARLIFQRQTGARVEVFLLQPTAPSRVISEIMTSKKPVVWETMIGNLKKWKEEETLQGIIQLEAKEVILNARLANKELMQVEFSWNDSEIAFVDLVEACGETPLPPYLNRKAEENDKSRYQTVYSEKEGAVAAPTAGLHFTEEVLAALRKKGIQEAALTLHVSAGTFQPIKVKAVEEHPMHSEQLEIKRETIEKLLRHTGKIVAVGTTSVRTLESMYWYGVQLIENQGNRFEIEKLAPYAHRVSLPDRKEALQAILKELDKNDSGILFGTTSIFIFPGYTFQLVDGLITNFHQPGSTLILLIASLVGSDWKKIYQEALDSNYRFLSYGDSSLLWS
ncbi:MAG: S-adenosylmethionine:tRNA ribosyltransferase-isomerase [Algoriphagus sp.]|nr:S-adenosylmethionine:tRNA ribosyltransferase-isomerase [Algoriphagus sp.]